MKYMMKKLAILLLISMFALASAQTIRIGAVASATGGAAALGEPEANTFRLFKDKFAEEGFAGVDVEIVFLDDATDTQKAVTNVRRLIEENDVHAVICCTISSNSLAVIDAIQEVGVPAFSMGAATAIIEPVAERKWIFKVPQTDRIMLTGLIEDMQAKGIQKVAFMGLDDAYGEGALTELQPLADAAGLELVAVERYGRTDTNVTAQVLKVVSRQPDAVIVWGVVRDTALVVEALKDRNYQGQIYVSHGVGNPSFLELAAEAAEGVLLPIGPLIVVDQLSDDNEIKAEALAYKAMYEEAYGENTATTFGGHVWDILYLLEHAAADALANGVDPDDTAAMRNALRDSLESIEPFVGVGGVFDFNAEDHLGLDERSMVIVGIKDGKWVLDKEF